jgi:hypothetical protein
MKPPAAPLPITGYPGYGRLVGRTAFRWLRAGTPPAMRRVRVREKDGVLYLACRKCGCTELLAKISERGRRTQHVKCAQCGRRQRYRQPQHALALTTVRSESAAAVHSTGTGDRTSEQDGNVAVHRKAEAIHWNAAAIRDHAAVVADEHAQHTVKDETASEHP